MNMSEPTANTPTNDKRPDSVTPRRPEPFRLSAVSIVLAILVVLGGLAIAIRGAWVEGLDSYNTGGAVGGAIGMLIVPFIVGWVGYLVVRRSNFVGNALFLIMLVIALLGQGGIALRRAQQRSSIQQIESLSQQSKDAAAAGDNERALQLAEQTASRTKEIAANSSGAEKKMLEFSAAFIKRSTDLSRAYNAELTRFSEDGGADCAGLVDAAAFEKRLSLLESAIAAQKKNHELYIDLDKRTTSEMKTQGFSEKEIAGYIRGLTQGGRLQSVVRSHELEGLLLVSIRARLEILRDNLGKWTCGEDGVVTFGADAQPDALQKFDELARAINAASQEQAELNAKINAKK